MCGSDFLQSFEIQLLERLAHGREKAKGVLEKAALDNRHFAIATQAKLRRSMEVNKENRDGLIKALQERLKEHVSWKKGLFFVLHQLSIS